MFKLCTLEDDVRVAPQNLGKPLGEAVTAVIEQTFIDKVVSGLGLVVTLYDILGVGDGHIYHSDGGAHYSVKFRVVVFVPFVGETLVGKVSSMDEHGVHVTLGFFHDMFIPHHNMPDPSYFRHEDQAWMWRLGENDLYFAAGCEVRCKVTGVKFHALPTALQQQEQRDRGEAVLCTAERPFVPMEVTARADGDGLGMVAWY